MKILVDENIPNMSVQKLRELGHNVKDVRGTEDEGITDEYLWDMVQNESRLLISTDKGFTQYRDNFHCGILIVLLKNPNKDKIHQRVINAINQFSENEWKNLLVVVRDFAQSIWKAQEQ
ncbi:MAG: hypothetical protein GF353_20095 [Candidatus Lokiarchaeota archaeon]|nr:hypothetical protein [Candidatus Lokiarchaeota archaeon]